MKKLFFFVLSIVPILSFSQIFVENDAMLYIQKDAVMYYSSDVRNDGVIYNEGNMYIIGDLINTGSHIPVGTIHLIGTDQQISINNDTLSNLVISGGGQKYIISNLFIKDSLILEFGYPVPFASSRIVLLSESYISDGSDFSYIRGPLYARAKSDMYYPIGVFSAFMPIELHEVQGDSLLIGMSAHEFDIDNTPIAGKGTRKVLDTRYWMQDVSEGNLTYARISLPLLPQDAEFYSADSVVVAMAYDTLGPYRSSGPADDIISRIPELYVSSIDTANRIFYTLGIFHDVNWNLFYIPNALSQFATNPEDKVVKVYGNVFKPEGFSFTVKNQWGNTVFSTSSLEVMESEGWTGFNQRTGRREMTGQYLYYLEGVTKHDESFSTAGTIWIID